jgi:hypothetical protein
MTVWFSASLFGERIPWRVARELGQIDLESGDIVLRSRCILASLGRQPSQMRMAGGSRQGADDRPEDRPNILANSKYIFIISYLAEAKIGQPWKKPYSMT